VRVRVQTERCMGHAMCNAIAPAVFEVSDSGFNEMGEFDIDPELSNDAERGVNACPEQAILILQDS
jgi:ferredoxin